MSLVHKLTWTEQSLEELKLLSPRTCFRYYGKPLMDHLNRGCHRLLTLLCGEDGHTVEFDLDGLVQLPRRISLDKGLTVLYWCSWETQADVEGDPIRSFPVTTLCHKRNDNWTTIKLYELRKSLSKTGYPFDLPYAAYDSPHHDERPPPAEDSSYFFETSKITIVTRRGTRPNLYCHQAIRKLIGNCKGKHYYDTRVKLRKDFVDLPVRYIQLHSSYLFWWQVKEDLRPVDHDFEENDDSENSTEEHFEF